MGALVVARKAIADKLSEVGLNAHPSLPDYINTPMVLVTAGSPYVVPSDYYGNHKVAWNLIFLYESQSYEVVTDELDNMIETAILTLADEGYAVQSVNEPYTFEVGVEAYPAISMNITDNVRI